MEVLHGQAFTCEARHLPDRGEVEIAIEAGGGLQGAGFNASVGFLVVVYALVMSHIFR